MWVALLPAAYLLGTFPSAALVARANGIDITAVGSGNPGASNVTRALGWRKGVWVFVLDALEGCDRGRGRPARRRSPGRLLAGRGGDRRSRVPDHPPVPRRQGRRDRRRRDGRAAPARHRRPDGRLDRRLPADVARPRSRRSSSSPCSPSASSPPAHRAGSWRPRSACARWSWPATSATSSGS